MKWPFTASILFFVIFLFCSHTLFISRKETCGSTNHERIDKNQKICVSISCEKTLIAKTDELPLTITIANCCDTVVNIPVPISIYDFWGKMENVDSSKSYLLYDFSGRKRIENMSKIIGRKQMAIAKGECIKTDVNGFFSEFVKPYNKMPMKTGNYAISMHYIGLGYYSEPNCLLPTKTVDSTNSNDQKNESSLYPVTNYLHIQIK